MNELEDLENELAEALLDIDDKWDDIATDIETLQVTLEKSDITVEEVALVWIPVG